IFLSVPKRHIGPMLLPSPGLGWLLTWGLPLVQGDTPESVSHLMPLKHTLAMDLIDGSNFTTCEILRRDPEERSSLCEAFTLISESLSTQFRSIDAQGYKDLCYTIKEEWKFTMWNGKNTI
ncbi:hypothetical protein ACJX0J_015924, partial [Zea mays]